MKSGINKFVLLTIALLSFACYRAYCQDYSAQNIAHKYLGEKNYLLAYKYMIIFKYSNLGRLQKGGNSDALNKIDAKISELEGYLSSNVSWYVIKQSKGWTDQQTRDSVKNQGNAIRFENINIK